MTQQIKFLMKRETKWNGNNDAPSVSSSYDETPEWRRGLSETQAMYIATEFHAENDLRYDDRINHIDPDDRNRYLKQFKKARRYWNENQAVQAGVKRRKIQKQYNPR